MKNQVLRRLMVVSTCGMVLSGMPIAEAEEVMKAEQEQVATVDTQEPQENEALEQEEQAPDQTETKVEVVNDEPVKESVPVLKGIKNQTIKEGDTFDPKAGVSAQDELEGDLTDRVQIMGTVDVNKAGEYTLIYSVTNSTGKTATETATIQVEKKPVAEPISERPETFTLEINDFTALLLSDLRAQIEDQLVLRDLNGDIVPLADVEGLTIDQSEATKTLGAKNVILSVTAKDGTVSEKTITVTVVSSLRVETADFTLIDADTFDPYAGIQAFEKANDGSEKQLGVYNTATKTGIEVIKNTVDLSMSGNYELRYRVHSSLGETVERSVNVTVMVKQIFDPTIYLNVSDHVMYVGEELTSEKILGWADVSGADQIAYEILDQMIPLDAFNRLTTAGTYRIRFTATKEGVPSVQKDITLTVRDYVFCSKPAIQTQTIRTSPQLGSVRTERKLPKTGEVRSGWLNPLLGGTLIGLVAFLKREKLLSTLTRKK